MSVWLQQGGPPKDGDHTVRVWDVANGNELHALIGHTDAVTSVAWDTTGKRLASASTDTTVRVWDVANGKELQILTADTGPVISVAWDANGERLAAGSADKQQPLSVPPGTVRIWDVKRSQELCVLRGHTEEVNSVAWDPKGERLASASSDTTIRIWDVASGRELHILIGHNRFVCSVVWDMQGEKLASASNDQTIRIWDAASGKELRVLAGHTSGGAKLSWKMDNQWLASAGADRTLRIWDVTSSKELRIRIKGHQDIVNSIVWNAKSERLASAGGYVDHTVKVWNVMNGKELHSLQVQEKKILVSGMVIEGGDVNSVSFHPDGEQLATGSQDNAVQVWDVVSGKRLLSLQGHWSEVNCVNYSPDGRQLASASSDRTVRIWDSVSGKEVRCLKHNLGAYGAVKSLSYHPNGQQLATGNNDRTIRIWDIANSKELLCLKGHIREINSVCYHPGGQRLASGSWDGTARLWDVVIGKELQCFTGHTGAVTSVAFDKKGERLVSGSRDKSMRVWDVATGKELGCIQLPYEIHSCAWITQQNQELLATAYGNGIVCFTISMVKNILQMRLNWSAISGADLITQQLDITGVIGLSPINFGLLQQRGAIGDPITTKQIFSATSKYQKIYSSLDTKDDLVIKNDTLSSNSEAVVVEPSLKVFGINSQTFFVQAHQPQTNQLLLSRGVTKNPFNEQEHESQNKIPENRC